MNVNFSKTKIICTIGPATRSIDKLIELVNVGMDIVRLNFSHGSYKEHEETISNIREAEKKMSILIPILIDLCGPKLRIGILKEEFLLKSGDEIIITSEDVESTKERISTIYKDLHKDVKPNDVILIDDGLIKLSILSVKGNDVFCKVIDGGLLRSKKGMNLPGVHISAPSITEKDKEDVEFGINHNIDFFALSFVRYKKDIQDLRDLIQSKNKQIPIIAKIEKPEAISDINGIIQESDIVMVARGDLGVEMNTEDVPILQKKIIEKCNYFNKPVITATQMLESMIHNPRPTRAEANDVANAVFDGTDAVMLSAETSVGEYPVQTVAIMNKIVRRAEQKNWPMRSQFAPFINEDMKRANDIAKAACLIAHDSSAAAIIALTKTGRTARLLSKYRVSTPILAFTEDIAVIKSLRIVWGVHGVLIDRMADTDSTLLRAKEIALKLEYVKPGDVVVFVAGIPMFVSNIVNTIKIEKV
jgi:pyruvate kinase